MNLTFAAKHVKSGRQANLSFCKSAFYLNFMPVSALLQKVMIICAGLLLPLNVMGQSGSILGMVIDSTTGIPLDRVRVGISDIGFTTSDEHGLFILRRVPVGVYTLEVESMGYDPQEIQISSNGSKQWINPVRLIINFKQGDRLLSQLRKRDEAHSLTRQNESQTFNSVLSSQQIEAFAARTVQDVMPRFAGVHTGGQRDMNLRGANFNQYRVMLNGRPMASTGFGDRMVDLRAFSTDQVYQVELIRVITPDMQADGLAGVVNMRTRRPIGDRSLSGKAGIGAHPAYFKYGGTGSRADLQFSEAIRDDLSVALHGSFQQDHVGWETLNLDYDVADFGSGRIDVIRQITPGLHTHELDRLTGGIQLDYKPSERAVMTVYGFYNQDGRTMDRHLNYWDSGGDWLRTDTTGAQGRLGSYGYDARRQDYSVEQFSIQTEARHVFDIFDLEYSVNWSSATARQTQYDFPFRLGGLNYSIDDRDWTLPVMTPTNIILRRDGTIDYRIIRFQNLERTVNNHADNTFSGTIDVEFPLRNASIKAGSSAILNTKIGEYRENSFAFTRTLDLNRFRMIPQGEINILGNDNYLIPWIINTEFGRLFLEENTPFFVNDENYQRRNSDIWNYDHSEIVLAGYGMGTLRLGRAEITGGFRIEHTIASYEGKAADFNESNQWMGTESVEADRQYTRLFPHGQLAYMPMDNATIRLAYSRSIARSAYNWLSPFELNLRQDSTLVRGNPALDPVTSENLDLLMYHYSSDLGHVGIRLFYKRLSDSFIEVSRLHTTGEFTGFTERYFENSDYQASLYGIEFTWQQRLSFLPGVLGNLGAYATYTLSGSEFEFETRPDEKYRIPGQSPHIVNAALNYSQGRLFTQVTYSWVTETLSELAGFPEWAPRANSNEPVYLDRYDGGYSDLAVSIGFRISEHFRFWADATNLLVSERINYAHSRSVYPYETTLRQGLQFRTGFRYNL